MGCADDDGSYNLSLNSESAQNECNPNPDITNLIKNARAECDTDKDDIPDGWNKEDFDSEHILTNVLDTDRQPNSKVLKSEFTGETSNWFGWNQQVTLEPDTYYELSVDFATDKLEPIIRSDGTISYDSKYLGVGFEVFNTAGQKIDGVNPEFWSTGVEMADWDSSSWVFRAYKTKGFENWRNYKAHFKTPSSTSHGLLRTYNYVRGIGYYDNFILRKVPGNNDPTIPTFKKSGTLDFLKYKGADFFPIVALGFPFHGTRDNSINISMIKDAGFNTIRGNSYNELSTSELKELWKQENMAVLVNLPDQYYQDSDSNTWKYDPDDKIDYIGVEEDKESIILWGNYENTLFFLGPDEIDCFPNLFGSYINQLNLSVSLKNYVDSHSSSQANLLYNYCHSSAYTGLEEDMEKYYYPLTDVISYTINAPKAYPGSDSEREINKFGEIIRKTINNSYKRYANKVMAFGLGVYFWSEWDGRRWDPGSPNYAMYVPLNLQRYQIYDQLINGAVGVWFYGMYHMNLDDQYFLHHFNQVKTISKELSNLYPVLLEPDFYGDWEISDPRINAMMKKHGDRIYLIAVSSHYEDIYDVKIDLKNLNTITSIKALNENDNHNIDLLSNRTISVSGNSFTDDFKQQRGAEFIEQDPDAPGYAVHIYEVEYS